MQTESSAKLVMLWGAFPEQDPYEDQIDGAESEWDQVEPKAYIRRFGRLSGADSGHQCNPANQ